MSRIGNKPIQLPAGVTVEVQAGNVISVKGPKGSLEQVVDQDMIVEVVDGVVSVKRPTEQKRHKAMHGLYRSLISNMVVGVTEGYKKQLELVGVGYKAVASGQILELNLGFSHSIYMQVPAEVKVTAESAKGKSPIVTLESVDKQLIGQVCAKIRSLRPVEPYKGKGVRFVGEIVRRKAGKQAAK
ncbi:50S ribosomal protein L6 [Fulvitalea axinellae]|uniref:Large ribosomal subunit protein uL6 n=1 Tax=Fulvitalea axinellae TaxID=1182444 RepID=A0AAU9CFI7_9BACT|nr:50S ribosomal protein L6 [Fulvitalea axinellae]